MIAALQHKRGPTIGAAAWPICAVPIDDAQLAAPQNCIAILENARNPKSLRFSD